MSNSKKRLTIIELFKLLLKRVRISTLILLLITLGSSTFAWFLYATKVSVGITAHIEAWNILFTNENNEISEVINFTIPNLYPGMEDFNDSIEIINLGERNANVEFEIVSVSILGVNHNIDGTTLTSDQMINNLASDYPFKIRLSLSQNTIEAGRGRTTFSISTVWPYESGDDDLDTYWGSKSYEFSSNNPDTPSIQMEVKISAIQETA